MQLENDLKSRDLRLGSAEARELVASAGSCGRCSPQLSPPPCTTTVPHDSLSLTRLDNKAAGDLAYNPEHHPKTRHIDRRHFCIRECVENHRLRVPFVNSHDNLADFFTKPLNEKNFFRLRDIIMNVQHDPPSVP